MKNIHNMFGVCGNPILHSKSPAIFKFLLNNLIQHNSYYIRINASDAKEAIDIINALDMKGLNITSPFKHKIIKYIDYLDEDARNIGAVNLICRKKNKLDGYNFDHSAITALINKYQKYINRKKCLVIGAGGAGRASVYALIKSGFTTTIINRTDEKAESLADEFKCSTTKWTELESEISKADFCINTLSRNKINIDNLFRINQLVIMSDYSDANNNLNQEDSEADLKISGLEWLIEQAYLSYIQFTGIKIEQSAVEPSDILETLDEVTQKNNISLIGFIGSGKTAVGKSLAQKMNMRFVDTDELIVEKEQMPISHIFNEKGEDYFRKLEKGILDTIKDEKGIIISCGGGIILDDDNRKLLSNISNVFWIFSPLEICLERLNNDLRPPLTNPFHRIENPLERAEILFNYRIPYYCDITDCLIFNNNSIENAAEKINEEIRTCFEY